MLKSVWLSLGLNVLLAIIGVLQATDWVNIVGSDTAGIVATGLALVNMALHYFSGQSATTAVVTAAQTGSPTAAGISASAAAAKST